MTDRRIDTLMKILQQHFNPREEGWLWIALYADGRDGGVLNQIEGECTDIPATAHALTTIITGGDPDRVYLALCRWDGRPRESDRELWRMLDAQISSDKLADMIVFNDSQRWSMRADNIAAA